MKFQRNFNMALHITHSILWQNMFLGTFVNFDLTLNFAYNIPSITEYFLEVDAKVRCQISIKKKYKII